MNELHSSDQVVIQKLKEIVIANLHNEDFGVKELSSASGISRSTIHRKLKTHLNKSISKFIREIRLERAMEMLRIRDETVSEIAYNVGFRSPTYFNSCFHHYFGFPPGEVKRTGLPPNNEIKIQTSTPKSNSSENRYSFFLPEFVHRNKSISLFILFAIFFGSITLSYSFYKSVLRNPDQIEITKLKDKNKSIAVLPFKNLSSNTDNQYFADGIMENIINILCTVEDLKVISRASVERFRESDLSAREIAKKLKVKFILEGSVQRDGDKVKILTQLIDARNDKNIWSEKSENHLYDIFAVQSSIAQKIATELKTVLSPEEIQRIEQVPTKNTEAYNLYLKGRFFWNTRTVTGLEKSKEYFEAAIKADPEYANAYNGLADTYLIKAWMGWTERNAGFALAKKYALKALEIDPTLPEAHATLGGIFCWAEWNWKDAENELITSIEQNPHYTMAYQYYSELLDILGRKEEAFTLINTALEFNPFFNGMNELKSLYYFNQGKYEESLKTSKNAIEFDPNSTGNYWRLFYIYLKQGKDMEALESLREIVIRDSITIDRDHSIDKIYAIAGMHGILKWLITKEKEKTNPRYMFIARWYILLGDETESLKWLEMAMKVKSPLVPRINTDPDFNCLRDNPHFKRLVSEMGLEPSKP